MADDALMSPTVTSSLEQDVRARRLWYNDIEIDGQLRTRFPEDYAANPVLEAVDRSNRKTLAWLDRAVPKSLSGKSVLDLGCADGMFSVWAARRGARRVLGIERNRHNFAQADWLRGALELRNAEFRCGALERHIGDETFDHVFCLSLLYHLVDPLVTLQRLRGICRGRLYLVCAVDLPESGDAPLSRLDRYATGAHGMWSFNLAMIRQMLSTAGFAIDAEDVEERAQGSHYSAVCSPGAFDMHHVFADTIDQEFPIDIARRRERARQLWTKLAEDGPKTVALFGAGTHTPWLLEQVADIPGVNVTCVLDERIPLEGTIAGLPVRCPTRARAVDFDAIVLSSWHQQEALGRRARELFGHSVKILHV